MQLLKITALGLGVLLLHSIATVLGWYDTYWWFDIPMHFLGGVAMGIASYHLLNHAGVTSTYFIPKLMQLLLIISITGLAAVAWEVFEFNFDWFFQTHMQGNVLDTMKDMCMGIMGGAFAGLLIFKKPR